MALTSRRFVPLFGISLALMLAPLLAAGLGTIRSRKVVFGLALLALGLSCVRVVPYSLQAQPSFHYLAAEYSYPEDMLDFIGQNGIEGNVYALYNWGGYLHWRTDGALKVFIDGRADTVYDADTYLHYGVVLNSRQGWIDALEQSGAQYMLWPTDRAGGRDKLRQLEATGRWTLLYRDALSWLAARSPSSSEALQDPVDSPARELTLAMAAALRGDDEQVLAHTGAVRRDIPWHKTACQLQVRTLMKRGQRDAATAVLTDCLGYFPTDFLP